MFNPVDLPLLQHVGNAKDFRGAALASRFVDARQLADEFAWPTFTELLPDTDFFIRKAIGWTLREISAKDPEAVFRYLAEVGDRASRLTRREGSRRLPEHLRKRL